MRIDEKLGKLDLSHLERGQQVQLRWLLTKHKNIFSDKSGMVKAEIRFHDIGPR